MPREITDSIQQTPGTGRLRLVIAFLAGMALTAAAAALLSPGPGPYPPQPVVPGLNQDIYPGSELVRTITLPAWPA